MPQEAKIGLLLGLTIIFVIAFVLNEMPRFSNATDSESIINSKPDNTPGIGALERDHLGINIATEPVNRQKNDLTPRQSDNERVININLPVAPPDVSEPPADEKPAPKPTQQQQSTVFYTIATGDNLASIAKKFYGATEGNRYANILRIFQANRQLLSSPDDLNVGQKIIIPSLNTSETDKALADGVLPSSMFEKVKSIGMRHSSTENSKPARNREYVVKEGDNLWRIAAAQLGDGTRFKEIKTLNADVLKDESKLKVGMRLRLPAK